MIHTTQTSTCPAWCWTHADGDGPDGPDGREWHQAMPRQLDLVGSREGAVLVVLSQPVDGAAPVFDLIVGDDEHRDRLAHVQLDPAQVARLEAMLAAVASDATDQHTQPRKEHHS